MKFAITSEHRFHYDQNHLVELEGLLSQAQTSAMAKAVDNSLAKRLKINEQFLTMQQADQLFMVGRDLSREDPIIQRTAYSSNLAAVAAELTNQKTIRFGNDQLYLGLEQKESNPYCKLITTTPTLEEICCLQGVICGLMLCLKNSSEENGDFATTLFSKTAGNGVYFSAKQPLDLPALFGKSANYLMIVYVQSTTTYFHNPKDPLVFSLKQLGYNYGDRLNDKFHPILYRR